MCMGLNDWNKSSSMLRDGFRERRRRCCKHLLESSGTRRSAVGGIANISYSPRAQQGQPMTPTQIIPSDPVFLTKIPEDGKPTLLVQTPPVMPVS
uniref:Uncharacterized protein n=2 Tax=Zea mays TaxID=4577 RepID=A0A804M3L9_MAIZE